VLRTGTGELVIDYVDGTGADKVLDGVTPNERLDWYESAARTVPGQRLGLLYLLTQNLDRNDENLIVRPDGSLSGIDFEDALNFGGDKDPAAPPGSLSSKITAGYQQFDEEEGRYQWSPNPLTAADVAWARERLDDLRPEFEAAGHGRSWEFMHDRFEAVAQHASGTVNVLAPTEPRREPEPPATPTGTAEIQRPEPAHELGSPAPLAAEHELREVEQHQPDVENLGGAEQERDADILQAPEATPSEPGKVSAMSPRGHGDPFEQADPYDLTAIAHTEGPAAVPQDVDQLREPPGVELDEAENVSPAEPAANLTPEQVAPLTERRMTDPRDQQELGTGRDQDAALEHDARDELGAHQATATLEESERDAPPPVGAELRAARIYLEQRAGRSDHLEAPRPADGQLAAAEEQAHRESARVLAQREHDEAQRGVEREPAR
jgi:hypothetical protein